MTDYLGTVVSIFGSGNTFLLSMILMVAVYGAINGVRGEILKFFIFMLIFGLSFLTTPFVTISALIAFSFYYGRKIYKGIQRQ